MRRLHDVKQKLVVGAEATNIESYPCRGDAGSGVIANDKELSPEY